MQLTWIWTSDEPQTWQLGYVIRDELRGVCGTVEQLPGGDWYWCRSRTVIERGDPRQVDEGGIVDTKGIAMTLATGGNKARVREVCAV